MNGIGKAISGLPVFWTKDEDDDDGEYYPYSNVRCITCSSQSGIKTAKPLLDSGEWTFYYCYRCRGWFQKHYRIKHLKIPIRDRAMLKSLHWFYLSELQFAEMAQSMNSWVRRFYDKLKGIFLASRGNHSETDFGV